MANKTQKPTPEYDQVRAIYRRYRQQAGYGTVGPASQSPDDQPWYQQAAPEDIILGGLYKSVGDNEEAMAGAGSGTLEVSEFQSIYDGYELARQGLDRAIEKRRRELQQKAPQEET